MGRQWPGHKFNLKGGWCGIFPAPAVARSPSTPHRPKYAQHLLAPPVGCPHNPQPVDPLAPTPHPAPISQHKGGTSPTLKVRATPEGYPAANTGSLGTDGSLDASSWGHVKPEASRCCPPTPRPCCWARLAASAQQPMPTGATPIARRQHPHPASLTHTLPVCPRCLVCVPLCFCRRWHCWQHKVLKPQGGCRC